MKKRAVGLILLILSILIATAAAFRLGIGASTTNVAGAFAAAAVLIVVSKAFQVSDGLYYSMLIFVFLASPMGSILNLYRTVGPYDKIVHFISGILLASFGMMLIDLLMTKALKAHSVEGISLSAFRLPMVFAACMVSSGAAGIWEIFEFIADKLVGGSMQRGMVDTVTDIIAGNLGALFYGVGSLLRHRFFRERTGLTQKEA